MEFRQFRTFASKAISLLVTFFGTMSIAQTPTAHKILWRCKILNLAPSCATDTHFKCGDINKKMIVETKYVADGPGEMPGMLLTYDSDLAIGRAPLHSINATLEADIETLHIHFADADYIFLPYHEAILKETRSGDQVIAQLQCLPGSDTLVRSNK